jgi:hypothetical protein
MKHALTALLIALTPAAVAQEACSEYAGPEGKRATFFAGGEMSARDAHGNVYETCTVEEAGVPMTFNVFCDQRDGTLVVNPTARSFDMFGENWRPDCPTPA